MALPSPPRSCTADNRRTEADVPVFTSQEDVMVGCCVVVREEDRVATPALAVNEPW